MFKNKMVPYCLFCLKTSIRKDNIDKTIKKARSNDQAFEILEFKKLKFRNSIALFLD